MPFMCNGKVLDLSKVNSDDPSEKHYARLKQKLIKDYNLKEGGRINIIYPKYLVKVNPDNPGKPDKPRGFQLEYNEVVQSERGTEHCRYYRTSVVTEHGVTKYAPISELFPGSWSKTMKDIDELTFIFGCSSRFIGGLNENPNKRKYMVVDDPEREAREKVELKKKEQELKKILYAEPKQGGFRDSDIRRLAASLFIPNFKDEDINILRLAIEDKVMINAEGMKKFEEFFEIGAPVDTANIREVIQDAYDMKVISIHKGANKKEVWKYFELGAPKKKIIDIRGSGVDPIDQLFDFYAINEKQFQLLEEKLAEAKTPPPKKIKPEDLKEPEDGLVGLGDDGNEEPDKVSEPQED